jgi:hypothetical protein
MLTMKQQFASLDHSLHPIPDGDFGQGLPVFRLVGTLGFGLRVKTWLTLLILFGQSRGIGVPIHGMPSILLHIAVGS